MIIVKKKPHLSLIQWLNISFYFILLVFFLLLVQKIPKGQTHGKSEIIQEIRDYFRYREGSGQDKPSGSLIAIKDPPPYWQGWHRIERYIEEKGGKVAIAASLQQEGMLWIRRSFLWDSGKQQWSSEAKALTAMIQKDMGRFLIYWWILVDETGIITDDDRDFWAAIHERWEEAAATAVGWMVLPSSMEGLKQRDDWIILEIREAEG